MRALVTTVIPTYRRPQLLQRAILSALRQTMSQVEVVVCDNASGDETEEVVNEIARRDRRVRYYSHPTNIGSYRNFNFGIQAVQTPYFSLLSDDDILAPKFYETTLNALSTYNEAMFACMASAVIDQEGNVISPPAVAKDLLFSPAGAGFRAKVARPIPAAWTSILFRTAVRDEIGLINPEAGPFADGGYVMHAAARFPFVDVPGVGAVLMAQSKSTSATVGPITGQWQLWRERMIRDVADDPKVPEVVRKRLAAGFEPHYRKTACMQVLRALSDRNRDSAYSAARGAGECGYPFTSVALRLLIVADRWFGPVHWTMEKIRRNYKNRMKKSIQLWNSQYAAEVAFVRELEQDHRAISEAARLMSRSSGT